MYDVLGSGKVANQIKDHCRADGVRKRNTIDKLGRPRVVTVIDEHNLYRMIGRSDAPNASPFQDWVFGEVLPTIRKTVGYGKPDQVPKKMQGGAAHATVDGMVQRVEPAAAGGHYVTINDQKHYVGEGFDVKVKKGDQVEAGDMLSDGIPNPALITQYKGVGEGRRYFVNEFRKAMASSGIQGHRRNIELLARGLINHVQLTDEMGDHAPDDIVPYSTLEHTYKPRTDHERLTPKKALGHYLERPVLHYTIGTKVRPSMLKDFEEFGVHELPVHKNPPPFQPHMVRGMYQLQHDPDWMTQMYGSGLKHSLLESTARGAVSEERGTSFIPSLATGTGGIPVEPTENLGAIRRPNFAKPSQKHVARIAKFWILERTHVCKQAK